MKHQSFGDISLADYQRMTGRAPDVGGPGSDRLSSDPRHSWGRRVGLLGGAVIVALLCSAVGDYLGPWSGKSARDLSYTQAIEILRQQGPERWVTELGIGAATGYVMGAMNEMREIALAQSEVAERNVGAGFAQMANKAFLFLQELEEVGQFPSQHKGQLETLRERLTSK